MRFFHSIRLRLTLWYILLLALILAAFSAGIYLTLRHNLNANLDESLRTRSDELLAAISFEGEGPTLVAAISQQNPDPDDQFVRVFGTAGQVTFDTSSSGTSTDADALQDALSGRSSSVSARSTDETFRSLYAPILQDGQIAGALEVARSKDDVTETLDTLLVILAISYPATLAFASLGGVFLAGRALSPIDRMTRVARRLSAQELGQRLELQLPDDELGRLARTFDEMLDRLEAAFRQQRQFTTDASHELRTPLTAIKGQLEVALSKDRTAADYSEVLRSVNEEVDRLIRLMGSLLSLARADAGEIALEVESIDIAELAHAAIEQVRPRASEKGIELALKPDTPVTIQVDQDLVLQLLLNLLDNAIKYTPADGAITAGWRPTQDQLELFVSDTGPGIPAEHLPRIFDRFYRVDKSRSRAEGGVGLGLSISRWIAEVHGGSLSVTSKPGAGTTFTAALPLSDRRK